MGSEGAGNVKGELPVACTLSERQMAERRQLIAADIFSSVQRVRELPDGYELCFQGDAARARKLVDFITFERRCCQFFTFELIFEPGQGPIRLRMRGSDEAKRFIEAELLARDTRNVT